ncbi:Asp-tRNA(Asn)/Glu-tRNA(Gln) amidotransferase GatCAB subunit A [Candidatus Marinamargulisbacteria bacterium SCGC AG-439-L15]|nr:Asp-tRNA(Asn)/Glu-tRNA(Gln) amidotransferase GatCAB subunit A [Candidatus Marinamargulisbacteria bacterium SCGC AG-439-L15]RAP33677.1 Asp-tRNA(Asn)/Glu-tRNA(Gln) amidotransferase GatCAB subunit A [Candidatus Marinamargulisbacteria bacterium SCGC AG-439-L15]
MYEEDALAEAAIVDQKRASGESLPPYAGIPIGIKDNLNDKGRTTTCSSKMLEGYVSPYTATAVQKCRDAGFIPLCRLNMDEFAMGSSNEHSVYGAVKNPWDTDHVPGGSSGGSAAAVAANFVPVALGSDTGGSIRQPAAFTGTVGLKPSYGRVSRYGLVAFASSLDQIGPIARSVDDCNCLLSVLSGHDPLDSTSENQAPSSITLRETIAGVKVGVPQALLDSTSNQDVKKQFESAIQTLKDAGAEIVPITIGYFDEALSAYYIIAPAEASSNLARFDGIRFGYRHTEAKNLKEVYQKSRGEGFGAEVTRRILLGTFVLSSGYYDAYYLKAQKVRTLVKQQYDQVFEQVDVIAMPTTPTPAFKLNEQLNDPMTMYLNDIATIPVNLAGLPGISVPCGFSQENLPIGMQLVGPYFDEETVLSVANCYQLSTDYHQQLSPIAKEGLS